MPGAPRANRSAASAAAGRRDRISPSAGKGAPVNRTHVNGTLVASYDAQDWLHTHGSASYACTAHGELQSKTQAGDASTQYQYDAFGNLRQVQLPGSEVQIGYLVDARNRRVGKKVNGVLVQGGGVGGFVSGFFGKSALKGALGGGLGGLAGAALSAAIAEALRAGNDCGCGK